MAKAVQRVYDEWVQNHEGIDEVYGAGGICDDVAEAIAGVVSENIEGAELANGGQPGDDHAFPLVVRGEESYGFDVPCRLYETGGGYLWKKREGVVFKPEDIEIFEVPYPEEGFDMGHSEGGTHISGNRFEADISPNKTRADIKDRKNSKFFLLLSPEDLQELHDLTFELLRKTND